MCDHFLLLLLFVRLPCAYDARFDDEKADAHSIPVCVCPLMGIICPVSGTYLLRGAAWSKQPKQQQQKKETIQQHTTDLTCSSTNFIQISYFALRLAGHTVGRAVVCNRKINITMILCCCCMFCSLLCALFLLLLSCLCVYFVHQ